MVILYSEKVMLLRIATILLLIGITSYSEISNARTLRFETWTTDLSNQDLTLTPSGTGEVVTNSPVVIGGTSNDASALLQVDSTSQGILIPRMTTAQRTAIGTPADGLIVYDTDLDAMFVRANSAWVQYGQQGTEVKSATVTDGSSVGTVTEDNDNLINGNCTNTANTGDYTCTFQNAYASAPHCWVQNNGNDAMVADVTTTTTVVNVQWRSMCGPITSWSSPSTTWTGNVTWTGYYQQCGQQVEFWLKGAVGGTVTPTATDLTVTLPNSWTIDTTALSGYVDDSEMGTLGIANYHDTGATIFASGQRISYSSTTAIKPYNYNSNASWNSDSGSPVPWANGDEVFLKWKVPIDSLSDRGAGIDNNFRVFCKEQ